MASFLSSMYVASGDSAAAMAVTGDASQSKLPKTKSSTAHVHTLHAADTVKSKSNLEHLLQAYQRNGDSNKASGQSAAIVRELPEELGNSDNARMAPGVQQGPTSWGFINRGGEKALAGTEHKG